MHKIIMLDMHKSLQIKIKDQYLLINSKTNRISKLIMVQQAHKFGIK